MRIRFQPQDPNYPAEKKVHTNLGEFLPGQELIVMPQQEPEALRLIDNGDFVNPDADPVQTSAQTANAEQELAAAATAPAPAPAVEDELATNGSKKSKK